MKWGCQALLCDRNQLFLPMKLQNIYLSLSHMMPKPLKANRRLHQSRTGVNSPVEKHGTTTRVRWEKFGRRQSVVVKLPSGSSSVNQYELRWKMLNSYYIWGPFCLLQQNRTPKIDLKHKRKKKCESRALTHKTCISLHLKIYCNGIFKNSSTINFRPPRCSDSVSGSGCV